MLIDPIHDAVHFLERQLKAKPVVAIILGTGLGGLAKEIDDTLSIPYEQIPGMVTSTVESHKGRLIFGRLSGVDVVAMVGRFHFYEGYAMNEVTYPVRLMKYLGAQKLMVSNASGALNPNYQKGDLMLLDDHINLLPGNPLIGTNRDDEGPRFPDMSKPYDHCMNQLLTDVARSNQIKLHHGIYAAVSGPNLETRAEYRYLRIIGADVVGMSTVPEVIIANHIGLPCAAISVITDTCDPDNLHPVSLAEIIEVAAAAEPVLTKLIVKTVAEL
ncbi:MAG: purine-nucleoside phosphorylase [Bacteroidetes bacterium]|nr:purine-nucleoside phosphorylase [Bacteroidota bacterium]